MSTIKSIVDSLYVQFIFPVPKINFLSKSISTLCYLLQDMMAYRLVPSLFFTQETTINHPIHAGIIVTTINSRPYFRNRSKIEGNSVMMTSH